MHREVWKRMYAWLDIASEPELDQRIEQLEGLLDRLLAPDDETEAEAPQSIQNADVRQDVLRMLRDIEQEKLFRVMFTSNQPVT